MDSHGSTCLPWLRKRKSKKHNESSASGRVKADSSGKAETSQDTVPSKKEYAFEATRRTVDILSGVVGLVGVPLVKEVIGIGLSILKTCETINQVQEKVEELKNRVAGFLVVIAKIDKDPEDNVLLSSSRNLMEELHELKLCLEKIMTRLQAINDQNIVLTTLLPDANLKTIEECVNTFQDGVAKFQTLRGIHAAQDLNKIQAQLEDIYGLTAAVSRKVDQVQMSVDEIRIMIERSQQESDLNAAYVETPPLPDVFLGRDAVVDRVAATLACGNQRLCILGPGGMGKTSVALAVMEHEIVKEKFGKNCLWISCISLRSPNALLAHLARRLGAPRQADVLQAVISTLQGSGEPCMLVLDNFETPWHPVEGLQSSTKMILQSLDKLPHITLLLTMRSEFPPLTHWHAERLGVLSPNDSRDIYTIIDPQAQKDEDLESLLKTVGGLPYAITLLANQARCSTASPKEMLGQWQAKGSKMLADIEDGTRGMDSSIELSVESKYVTTSPGAIELLQALSMLPAGVYRDDLSIWISSWEFAALGTLRNAALVVAQDVVAEGQKRLHLHILPVVQSYMRQRGRIPAKIRDSIYDACFTFLASHKSIIDGPNAPTFGASVSKIAAQEANIQAILTEFLQAKPQTPQETQPPLPSTTTGPATSSVNQLDGLLTFVSHQCHTRPRVDIVEQVVAFMTRYAKATLHEAKATYCLAIIKFRLWQIAGAATLFEVARKLFLDLGELAGACDADFSGVVSRGESAEDEEEKRVTLRSGLEEARYRWESSSDNPIISGRVAFWTGRIRTMYTSDFDSDGPGILENFFKAREAFTSLHHPWDLRDCLISITRHHLHVGQVEEARARINEGFELTERMDLPDTGGFHYQLAQCLKASDNWGPELVAALNTGLTLARKGGLQYNAACMLEQLAEVYIRKENWEGARLTLKECLKECSRSAGSSIDWVAKRARHNLIYIAEKETDPSDDCIEYHSPPRS